MCGEPLRTSCAAVKSTHLQILLESVMIVNLYRSYLYAAFYRVEPRTAFNSRSFRIFGTTRFRAQLLFCFDVHVLRGSGEARGVSCGPSRATACQQPPGSLLCPLSLVPAPAQSQALVVLRALVALFCRAGRLERGLGWAKDSSSKGQGTHQARQALTTRALACRTLGETACE